MKLGTIRTADGTRAVRLEEGADVAVEVGFDDVGALLADPSWRTISATTAGASHPVDGLDFAPIVPRPSKVLCVGKNYRDHIEEMGGPVPDYPTLFPKFADSLIGANDPIPIPHESSQVDWEAELCIVIGSEVRRADESAAVAAIAGFTVLNDISMRDFQRHTSQFTAGKIWEGSTPVGPWLAVVDHPGEASSLDRSAVTPGLTISTAVDGEVMQDANTSQMVFDPVNLVQYISTLITLRPGDLIATGTPGGVGAGRDPQVFLRPGQTVVTAIDTIGQCRNETVAD